MLPRALRPPLKPPPVNGGRAHPQQGQAGVWGALYPEKCCTQGKGDSQRLRRHSEEAAGQPLGLADGGGPSSRAWSSGFWKEATGQRGSLQAALASRRSAAGHDDGKLPAGSQGPGWGLAPLSAVGGQSGCSQASGACGRERGPCLVPGEPDSMGG